MNGAEIIDGSSVIKVIGAGGGGMHAVNHMVTSGLQGMNFIAVGTDAQALATTRAYRGYPTVQVGVSDLYDWSQGSNPNSWSQTAQESFAEIKRAIGNADLVFVVVGLGGSTGSITASVIAEAAKESGALTVGVASMPLSLEGKKRWQQAEAGLKDFFYSVDCLIAIPIDRLTSTGVSAHMTFAVADEAVCLAVRGVSDLIVHPGDIAPDFGDVRSAIINTGGIIAMGLGTASGNGRARAATKAALTCPLLEGASLNKARSVLMHIAAHSELTISEVTEAVALVQGELHDGAPMFWGAYQRENLAKGELCITLFIMA